jgi:hypothetical protein
MEANIAGHPPCPDLLDSSGPSSPAGATSQVRDGAGAIRMQPFAHVTSATVRLAAQDYGRPAYKRWSYVEI